MVFSDIVNTSITLQTTGSSIGQELQATIPQSIQCPSEAITTFTLDEKISVLTGNIFNGTEIAEERQRTKMESSALFQFGQVKQLKCLPQESKYNHPNQAILSRPMSQISQKSDFLMNEGSNHGFKEQHVMKTFYMTKINQFTGSRFKDLNVCNSQKRKSSSQSVSGGIEEGSSRSGSKVLCQTQAARSLCQERNPTISHFETRQNLSLKRLSDGERPPNNNLRQQKGAFGVNHAMDLSDIGSVFESQLGRESQKQIESLDQIKNLDFLTRGSIANKDMTIEQILQNQSNLLQQEMSNFRQKICRKGFEILHKEKGVIQEHAKIITLMVDGMVKTRYPDERELYFTVIKKIFRSIRVSARFDLLTHRLTPFPQKS